MPLDTAPRTAVVKQDGLHFVRDPIGNTDEGADFAIQDEHCKDVTDVLNWVVVLLNLPWCKREHVMQFIGYADDRRRLHLDTWRLAKVTPATYPPEAA